MLTMAGIDHATVGDEGCSIFQLNSQHMEVVLTSHSAGQVGQRYVLFMILTGVSIYGIVWHTGSKCAYVALQMC